LEGARNFFYSALFPDHIWSPLSLLAWSPGLCLWPGEQWV